VPEEHGHFFAAGIESSCWPEKPAASSFQTSNQLSGLTWITVQKLEETMWVILKYHQEQLLEIATLQSDVKEESFIIHQLRNPDLTTQNPSLVPEERGHSFSAGIESSCWPEESSHSASSGVKLFSRPEESGSHREELLARRTRLLFCSRHRDYIELCVDGTRLRNSSAVLFSEVPDDSCDAVDEDDNQRHLSEEFICWSRNAFKYA